MPSSTNIYRCPKCGTINSSSTENTKSNKYNGNEIKGLVKSDPYDKKINKCCYMSQNSSKSVHVLNQMSPSFSSYGRSKKRAVLCGVTYRKKRYRLKGTINDVANMRELLVKVFEFPPAFIIELTGIF